MTVISRDFEGGSVKVDTVAQTASIIPHPFPPPDNPPTIRITKPARAGKSFKSQITIAAEASSDSVYLQLFIDGKDVKAPWLAPTHLDYLWKPGKKVKPGKHKIEVRAYDSAEQSAVASTWVKRV